MASPQCLSASEVAGRARAQNADCVLREQVSAWESSGGSGYLDEAHAKFMEVLERLLAGHPPLRHRWRRSQIDGTRTMEPTAGRTASIQICRQHRRFWHAGAPSIVHVQAVLGEDFVCENLGSTPKFPGAASEFSSCTGMVAMSCSIRLW